MIQNFIISTTMVETWHMAHVHTATLSCEYYGPKILEKFLIGSGLFWTFWHIKLICKPVNHLILPKLPTFQSFVVQCIILNNIASEITVSLESLKMLLITWWERGLRNECVCTPASMKWMNSLQKGSGTLTVLSNR